jgi:hypothetical protein
MGTYFCFFDFSSHHVPDVPRRWAPDGTSWECSTKGDNTMQNIKATGKKFLVEMKNNSGEYEPLGVLSFHDAIQMQFTTHRAIRMQRVSDLDEREGY